MESIINLKGRIRMNSEFFICIIFFLFIKMNYMFANLRLTNEPIEMKLKRVNDILEKMVKIVTINEKPHKVYVKNKITIGSLVYNLETLQKLIKIIPDYSLHYTELEPIVYYDADTIHICENKEELI